MACARADGATIRARPRVAKPTERRRRCIPIFSLLLILQGIGREPRGLCELPALLMKRGERTEGNLTAGLQEKEDQAGTTFNPRCSSKPLKSRSLCRRV